MLISFLSVVTLLVSHFSEMTIHDTRTDQQYGNENKLTAPRVALIAWNSLVLSYDNFIEVTTKQFCLSAGPELGQGKDQVYLP